eukprot:Hpha_TRINITY_DN15029_c5_g9::TRINITY_DN15029_c5_g9_i1::g.125581::m.125581/K13755/PDE1; calcium/calmodulin-dependent 3',5'-cyclic nucleotide phosphodiesterase
MESEVARMPKLFTRCVLQSGTVLTVVAKIAPSGKGITMAATTQDNASYYETFDEGMLRKIGGGSPDWVKFFRGVLDNFVSQSCLGTIQEGNKEGCKVEVPQVGTFFLPPDARPNGHNAALEHMVSVVRIRNSKDPERMLKDVSDKEAENRKTVEGLRGEEQTLQKSLEQSRERDAANRKALAELESQLAALDKEKKAKSGETDDRPDPEEEAKEKVSRARNPLGTRDSKDYDKDVLRLVKSHWLTWDEPVTSEHRFLDVIVPMGRDEFTRYTQHIDDQRKQQIFEVLKKIDEWDYDVFTLQEKMSGSHDFEGLRDQPRGGALFVTCYALLMRHGFLQKFNMKESVVLNWLSVVESGYHPNPYHNSMHAADVLHITNYILCGGGLQSTCKLTDEDVFAAIFAATIHDYNHPGINNNFHIKAQTYLAVLYNDRSILENIHVSSVFELMKMEKFNVLDAFSEEQRRDVRETIIEMVLATDMGLHAKILGTFKRRLSEDHNFTKKDDIRLAMNMALKMADISNCGRPEHLYLRWCNKIADEFYMQGDRERNIGMACSPFMDRYQPAMAKGQIAFMNYIVIPLFECVSEFLPEMHFSVDFTENNKVYWANHEDS